MTPHEMALVVQRRAADRGLQPADIAGLSGVHVNTVWRMRHGENINMSSLIKIAQAVGLKVEVR